MHLTRLASAAVLGLGLTGCAVGPDYREPASTLPAPWTQAASSPDAAPPAAPAPDPAWWRRFDDPLLDSLVERALTANTDLRIAGARLRAARASNAQAEAALWPTVNAYGSATRSSDGGRSAVSRYGLGFDAGWEIDLFGGLRRGVEAADADAESSAATLAATQVTLVAEVARDYVLLRGYQRRLVITRANLEQTRAQLPLLQDAATQTRHALAVLLNESPQATAARLAAAPEAGIPGIGAQPLLGVPADLLRRRPDIVAAERSLAAATARIGVAEAARYPSFTLAGTLGLQGAALSALSGSGAATRLIAGSLTAPIFDAGRLREQVVIQTAAQEQALAVYEAALVGALRDVENARAALANGRERGEALAQAVQAARNAALLASFRYRSGLVDFQTVLDTERSVRTLEDSQASTQADTTIAMIQLYKALGGGWSAETRAASTTEP